MAFDPEQLVAAISNEYELRYREMDLAEDDIPVMVNFLARMSNVAIQLVSQEEDLKLPNTEHVIPFDDNTREKTVHMFMEGLSHALLQTAEMGIPDEARGEILQNVAQYVYENAKQVVLSTFGQEHTPEFQIPQEQQLSMVTQTAESALNFFISEYEKQHGPFNQEDIMGQADPMMNELTDDSDNDIETADNTEEEATHVDPPGAQPQPPSQSTFPPKDLPYPLEKYAALSLLLNVLPQQRGQALFNRFSPPEQATIAHFQNPTAMIEAGLDLPTVQQQLAKLKSRFAPTPVPQPVQQQPVPAAPDVTTTPPAPVHLPEKPVPVNPLYELKDRMSPSLARQLLRQERPAIREAIDVLFDEDASQGLLLEDFSNKRKPLSPAIQSILAEHLSRLVG